MTISWWILILTTIITIIYLIIYYKYFLIPTNNALNTVNQDLDFTDKLLQDICKALINNKSNLIDIPPQSIKYCQNVVNK